MAGVLGRRGRSMAATMADCKAAARRQGQRGRHRHNNMKEAGGGLRTPKYLRYASDASDARNICGGGLRDVAFIRRNS